ncbi:hypothetical protein ABIE09_002374 [Lysobacter enzymogenes]|uniref:hypothetical protein n=1 Tax=Lysobacter enzymogenes TaxID=69 RepID=UPI0033971526
MQGQMQECADANPWYVCFAMGLSWGHLAKLDVDFTKAVVRTLENWNDDDLKCACSYHLERGPEAIRQSLVGAYAFFGKVTLLEALPNSLEKLDAAQQRWLSPVLHPISRPKYIGSWNATAMFMAALFAQPDLAQSQRHQKPLLPPGGPVFNGLRMLYDVNVSGEKPAGSELGDQAFEPGALYINNNLLTVLCGSLEGWCLLDVHSGVYMLGTRHPHSASW